eukprot:TRINITY_DN80594_c0_g1_i1.p1 TRINITY_DN80594_c0_g1~~TRINITY_DN80594_c0_g1_i1.p1  ORF type:complete len:105 (+),score=19.94 TRINITY_DN80594_c0_g1_i1:483-797(+)
MMDATINDDDMTLITLMTIIMMLMLMLLMTIVNDDFDMDIVIEAHDADSDGNNSKDVRNVRQQFRGDRDDDGDDVSWKQEHCDLNLSLPRTVRPSVCVPFLLLL